MKKGEIKITVIASGFPDTNMKKNLFEEKGDGKGKIFNSVFGKEEKEEEKKQNIIEDDDEWGAVPAFLRRSKLK